MSKTESVLFKLGADVSGLTQGLAKGRAGLKDMEKGAEGLTGKLVGLAGILGVGLGFAGATREALQFADSVTKVAQQTGLSTDAVQRLAFFATQTGSSLEQVTSLVTKMQVNLVKAADGTEAQADAFAHLKINTETFFRLNPEEQLMAVAKGMSEISNPADRAATAVAALGKAGAESIPMLLEMAEKGDALNAQFDRMGGPMSANAIKALDTIGDTASATGQAVRNFAGELLALGAPAILGALEGITTFFAALRHSISGGDNELATVTGQIDELANRIAYMNKTNPFPDAFMKAQITNAEKELAILKERELVLIDAPMKEAQAKMAAAKLAPAPAEELADLVVHGEARKAIVLTGQMAEQEAKRLLLLDYQTAVEKMVNDHETRVTDIVRGQAQSRYDFQQLTLGQQATMVSDKLIEMTAATAQHSKTMFAINKAASLSKAIVDGYEAVQSAYKFGTGIGGPPVGAAFAAVAVAATAANIQAIAKTQFNGGGAGQAPSNATQAPTPVTQAGGSNGGGGNAGGGSVMHIQGITPDSLISGKMVRAMADRLTDHVRDGGRVEWAQ